MARPPQRHGKFIENAACASPVRHYRYPRREQRKTITPSSRLTKMDSLSRNWTTDKAVLKRRKTAYQGCCEVRVDTSLDQRCSNAVSALQAIPRPFLQCNDRDCYEGKVRLQYEVRMKNNHYGRANFFKVKIPKMS